MTGLVLKKPQGHNTQFSSMSTFRVVIAPISFTGCIEVVPLQTTVFNEAEEDDIGSGPATESKEATGLSLSVFMGIQCTDRFQSRSKEVDLSLDFGVGYKGIRGTSK